MKYVLLRWIAILAMLFGIVGCGSNPVINEKPAALGGDYSGKDFSGSYAVVMTASDIPGVPASKGKKARWSDEEVKQVLYLDAHCQAELFKLLPGWAQAIVKEGGWSALAIAVGQGAFASAFPGAEVARYILGGLGYGAFAGMNTGRYRQDSSEKSSMAYCMVLQAWDANRRYGILEGALIVPWYGNGQVELPKATSKTSDPVLPRASGDRPPFR